MRTNHGLSQGPRVVEINSLTLDPDPNPNWAKILDPDPNSMYLDPQHFKT